MVGTVNAAPAPGSTDRTKGRRIPENSVTETAALHAVLDAGLVAHVAVVDESGKYCSMAQPGPDFFVVWQLGNPPA